MLSRLICLVALLGVAVPAAASTAWVGDSIYVPIRAAANPGGRILHRGIKSGTRVEFLGNEGSWAHIRYKDIEGYIGKQYISHSPTAAIRLDQVTTQIEESKAALSKAQAELAKVKGERDALQEQVGELKGALSSRSNELEQLQEVAADPIRLDQANRRLNEELSLLRTELDQLKGENAMLRSNNTAQAWITGVGIFFFGAIMSMFLRSRNNRRRSSGWV